MQYQFSFPFEQQEQRLQLAGAYFVRSDTIETETTRCFGLPFIAVLRTADFIIIKNPSVQLNANVGGLSSDPTDFVHQPKRERIDKGRKAGPVHPEAQTGADCNGIAADCSADGERENRPASVQGCWNPHQY
ncbi:MAG: hypothetical protein IH846_04705 [Acidobacteria bacterium]|nr:hypothetical protein [Acidobacteriota bacterium]